MSVLAGSSRPAIVRPLDEVLKRASDPAGYERWAQQVKATGYCSRPVRLAGRVRAIDKRTGECRHVYDTSTEPDGTLLTACGQRREAVCPSCAATYRGDAWQIVAAGLRGGKGVPDSVASHPLLFLTLTAPSFGPVHSSRARGGQPRPCFPRRGGGKCPHGKPLACWARHGDADACLGEPLCAECFDYEHAVLWNALAPELWRRTAIAIRRKLARARGLTQSELRRQVRVSYVKVAEYQRRGALHFHVVLRLDAAQSAGSDLVEPPPEDFGVELLEEAARAAVDSVTATPPPSNESTEAKCIVWGGQMEVRRFDGDDTSGQVAAYIAKYATKSTEAVGGLLRRLDADGLPSLKVRPHVRAYVETAWRLGGREGLERLRLRRWAHALAYRGHCFTKSRRYSITFTALRRTRADYAAGRRDVASPELGGTQDPADVSREWQMVGIGYLTRGDAWLALSAAARAREQRKIASEELLTVSNSMSTGRRGGDYAPT